MQSPGPGREREETHNPFWLVFCKPEELYFLNLMLALILFSGLSGANIFQLAGRESKTEHSTLFPFVPYRVQTNKARCRDDVGPGFWRGQFLVTCGLLGGKGCSFLSEVWVFLEQCVCRLLFLWMFNVSLNEASISVLWVQLCSAPSSSMGHSSLSTDLASGSDFYVNYVKLGISCQLPIKDACKSLSFWWWPKLSSVLCQLGSCGTVRSWGEVAFRLVASGQWRFWSLMDILVYWFITCHESGEAQMHSLVFLVYHGWETRPWIFLNFHCYGSISMMYGWIWFLWCSFLFCLTMITYWNLEGRGVFKGG